MWPFRRDVAFWLWQAWRFGRHRDLLDGRDGHLLEVQGRLPSWTRRFLHEDTVPVHGCYGSDLLGVEGGGLGGHYAADSGRIAISGLRPLFCNVNVTYVDRKSTRLNS